MTKRLVDIDDDVLDAAKQALGTATLKETVNQSLVEATRMARRREITPEDLQRVGELLTDLGDPEVMRGAWE